MPASFTVLIPTHNRRELVTIAVRSAQAQTRPADRIVVICDGCTDGTQEAVGALGAEALDLPKAMGYGYANRNTALEGVTTDAVAWLGDDDVWLPDHLELVGEQLDLGLADIVTSQAVLVGADGVLRPHYGDWRVPHFREALEVGDSRLPLAAVAHRLSATPPGGGWPAEMAMAGDRVFFMNLLAQGTLAKLDRVTVAHVGSTDRVQDWEERPPQNEALLQRISDPAGALAFRAEASFAVAQDRGHMEFLVADLERRWREAEARYGAARADVEQMKKENGRMFRQLAGLHPMTGEPLDPEYEPPGEYS